jgi:hypothetical protein
MVCGGWTSSHEVGGAYHWANGNRGRGIDATVLMYEETCTHLGFLQILGWKIVSVWYGCFVSLCNAPHG